MVKFLALPELNPANPIAPGYGKCLNPVTRPLSDKIFALAHVNPAENSVSDIVIDLDLPSS
jgi:hypothetical protein